MNAEEVARELKCSSKTVLRHIAKGTITATHKNAQELEITEDQVEILRRVLASKSGQGTDMSGQMEKLTARVAELEERVRILESGQVSPQSPVRTVPTPIVPTATTPKPKPTKHPSTRKSDLPEGCILASEFAKLHGMPPTTFKHHIEHGIAGEKVEVERRPKPGRPKDTERYLTPKQQEKALEFWKRHNVKFTWH